MYDSRKARRMQWGNATPLVPEGQLVAQNAFAGAFLFSVLIPTSPLASHFPLHEVAPALDGFREHFREFIIALGAIRVSAVYAENRFSVGNIDGVFHPPTAGDAESIKIFYIHT